MPDEDIGAVHGRGLQQASQVSHRVLAGPRVVGAVAESQAGAIVRAGPGLLRDLRLHLPPGLGAVTEARVENHGGVAFPDAVEVEAPRAVDRDQTLRLRVDGIVDDCDAPCAIAHRCRCRWKGCAGCE